jgi:hypothetical protein
LTGEKYGDEFAFIPKFQDMLAKAGRDRSSCPITICLYPEELDAFALDQVGALARYEGLVSPGASSASMPRSGTTFCRSSITG